MELQQHPRHSRIFFVLADTHPAVKPQAEQRRQAHMALEQSLRASGYYATANEERGDVWVECLGEWMPFFEAKRLTERRI